MKIENERKKEICQRRSASADEKFSKEKKC